MSLFYYGCVSHKEGIGFFKCVVALFLLEDCFIKKIISNASLGCNICNIHVCICTTFNLSSFFDPSGDLRRPLTVLGLNTRVLLDLIQTLHVNRDKYIPHSCLKGMKQNTLANFLTFTCIHILHLSTGLFLGHCVLKNCGHRTHSADHVSVTVPVLHFVNDFLVSFWSAW